MTVEISIQLLWIYQKTTRIWLLVYIFLFLASNSGIVNLYSVEDIIHSTSDKVEPKKTIENLTTSCEFLQFNKTSNKLGFCSRWKKHAFKIVNII